MDLINPLKLWPSFCCQDAAMNISVSTFLWLCASVCVALVPEVGFVRKNSVCIFNFYGHCPVIPHRGANSWYPPVMSDLFPHCRANFLTGANVSWKWYQINCIYITFLLTQVSLRICVGGTHLHSISGGNECVLPMFICVIGPILIDL